MYLDAMVLIRKVHHHLADFPLRLKNYVCMVVFVNCQPIKIEKNGRNFVWVLHAMILTAVLNFIVVFSDVKSLRAFRLGFWLFLCCFHMFLLRSLMYCSEYVPCLKTNSAVYIRHMD
jgi:hypothetical protein